MAARRTRRPTPLNPLMPTLGGRILVGEYLGSDSTSSSSSVSSGGGGMDSGVGSFGGSGVGSLGEGPAQAPPVFRTLSHENAIKPKNLIF